MLSQQLDFGGRVALVTGGGTAASYITGQTVAVNGGPPLSGIDLD